MDKVTALLADEIISKGGKAPKFDDEFAQQNKDAWNKFLPHSDPISEMVTSWVNSLASIAHKFLRGTTPDVTSVLKNGNNLMY